MGFCKTMLAIICGELILGTISYGLKTADEKIKQRNEQHRRRMGFNGSPYSGKKCEGPQARKIGFGAND